MTRRDELLALLQPHVGLRVPRHRVLADKLGISVSRIEGLVAELRKEGDLVTEDGTIVRASLPRPGSFAAGWVAPTVPRFDATELNRAIEAERAIRAHAEHLEHELAAARVEIEQLKAMLPKIALRAWTALDVDGAPLASFASREEADTFVFSSASACFLRRERTKETVWRRVSGTDVAQPLSRPRRRAA